MGQGRPDVIGNYSVFTISHKHIAKLFQFPSYRRNRVKFHSLRLFGYSRLLLMDPEGVPVRPKDIINLLARFPTKQKII